MLDAAQALYGFVKDRSPDDYLSDRMLRGAVERYIELIAEAAGRISTSYRIAHPDIPWRSIIAQREVITHGYGAIKHSLLWNLATVHVPTLISQLEPLIPAPPATPE
jgi:uncharacterized protein with HEPN domain